MNFLSQISYGMHYDLEGFQGCIKNISHNRLYSHLFSISTRIYTQILHVKHNIEHEYN